MKLHDPGEKLKKKFRLWNRALWNYNILYHPSLKP